jgi:signal transduction histidine kinase
MLGYTEAEMSDLGVQDIHPEEDLLYVKDQFEKQVRKEIALAKDIPVKRKDGSVFYVDVNSCPVKLGERAYLLGVFRDITERKKAEETERKLEAQKLVVEELLELDRMKSEFVETVTHELRTPMTPLRSSVDLLLAGTLGELSPKQKEYLEMMRRNIERLSRFATEVLAFSRLESGRYVIRPCEMSVLSVTRTVVDLIEKKAHESEISIDVKIQSEQFAFADPDAVSEIMTNLVTNAIVHNPPGTQVNIFTGRIDDDWVEVTVADNGKGIPEEMLEKVFDKFFQGDREHGPGYRGTGIGLAVCRKLVEAMGGRISVEAHPGKGSVFRFTLPAKAGTES